MLISAFEDIEGTEKEVGIAWDIPHQKEDKSWASEHSRSQEV